MVTNDTHHVSPVTLSYTEELSEGIYLIGFKRNFIFKAGQVIGIAMEENGPRRLYSICSGEQEEEILILYIGGRQWNIQFASYCRASASF